MIKSTTFAALVIGMLAALTLPGAASARIIELGAIDGAELPAPSCPVDPCEVVTRTSAYQAKVGPTRGLFVAPENGRIVAFTVRLGQVNPEQNEFFTSTYGGAPSVGLSVLAPERRLFNRVVRQSRVYDVTRYLGRTSQFALTRSLRVRQGQVVALTVPTWAPTLQVGLEKASSWRGSRRPPCGGMETFLTQNAQSTLGSRAQYRCLYQTARLTYSATIITDADVNPRTTP